MARGYGWRCDNCETTVITPDDIVGRSSQAPPVEWFVVYRDRDGDERTVSDEWHLCRPRCLSEWATRLASP